MNNHSFFCVKLRKVYIFILSLILLGSLMALIIPQNLQTSLSPKPTYKIVLDAGHGGIDVGHQKVPVEQAHGIHITEFAA